LEQNPLETQLKFHLNMNPNLLQFRPGPPLPFLPGWPTSPLSFAAQVAQSQCTAQLACQPSMPAPPMKPVSLLRKRISGKPLSLHECVLRRKSATFAWPISAGPATTPPHPALAYDQSKLQAHQPSAPPSLPDHRGPSAFVLLRPKGQAEPRRLSVCAAAPEVPCPLLRCKITPLLPP
jgi:hypothetical protein